MEWEMGNKKKKWMIGLAVFLLVMLALTIISRSVYAYYLPLVETTTVQEKYIEHGFEEEGLVVAGNEIPVNTVSGLRIRQIPVQVGDRAEAGELLCRIDLEDLDTIISGKESEIEKLDAQIASILQNEELAKQKKELELTRAQEDYELQTRIGDTKVGRATESYVQAKEMLERAQENGLSEEEQIALEQSIQQSAYAESDAMAQRDADNKSLERKMEDLTLPEEETSTLEVCRMEKEALRQDLNRYEGIREKNGEITASEGGVVTRILTEAGARTGDTAIFLLADETEPCQLKVALTREQKKYIDLGDPVSVKLGNQELETKVEYVSEENGSYVLYLPLPDDTGIPGQSGTIRVSGRGTRQSKCVSPLAVTTEQNNSFVYVVGEREGILGSEYYIRQVSVKIIDKNDSWVSIEAESLDQSDKIVLSSTREFKKGDTVRLLCES